MAEVIPAESDATNAPDNTNLSNDYPVEVKIRTKKMLMWFIIFSIVMLFSGITSALIVLYGKLFWLHIHPPSIFWVSNALIILSSLTMVMAVRSIKRGHQQKGLVHTALTLLLGIGFVFTQNAGWSELTGMGMGYTITQNDKGQEAYRWNPLGKLKGEYGVDYYIEFRGERLEKVGEEYYFTSDTGRTEPQTFEVMSTFNASAALLSVMIYVHILHLTFGVIYLIVNLLRVYKGRISGSNWISLYTGGMYWHFMGILWLYLFFFLFYIY